MRYIYKLRLALVEVYSLDIMSTWTDDESVIPMRIILPWSRCAIVLTPSLDRSLVEGVNLGVVCVDLLVDRLYLSQ